jgi:hypothetical protein
MGGGGRRLDKALMDLFQLCGCLRQGELGVKQAPLDINVCFHQIFVAFTVGADHAWLFYHGVGKSPLLMKHKSTEPSKEQLVQCLMQLF